MAHRTIALTTELRERLLPCSATPPSWNGDAAIGRSANDAAHKRFPSKCRGMNRKSGHPESSQGPSDICNLYSQMLYQLSYSRLEVFAPRLPSKRLAHLECEAAFHCATLAGLEPAIFSFRFQRPEGSPRKTDALSIRPQGLCFKSRARVLPIISGVAQWLACWAHNPKVRGSKPRSATCLNMILGCWGVPTS